MESIIDWRPTVKRLERRERSALDEAYQYHRALDKDGLPADIFTLSRCLKTVSAALRMPDGEAFKLTRQLWQRMYNALFDKLITNFPGHMVLLNTAGEALDQKEKFPTDGVLEFHPEGLRRDDDAYRIEIKHLYPKTHHCLESVWKQNRAAVKKEDFNASDCGEQGCFLKPFMVGEEVLAAESTTGKEKAYKQWWELYWMAYCTQDGDVRIQLQIQMEQLESVWGNLFY